MAEYAIFWSSIGWGISSWMFLRYFDGPKSFKNYAGVAILGGMLGACIGGTLVAAMFATTIPDLIIEKGMPVVEHSLLGAIGGAIGGSAFIMITLPRPKP